MINGDNMYRNLVVGLDAKIPLSNGAMITAVNFDNAATTPPFKSVMKKINEFAPYYSSIHRGAGYKSMLSSSLYDNSRKVVAEFVNASPDHDTVIYVKNTTEAINKLSYTLTDKNKKNIILSSDMEHHSNDLPWRDKYRVEYIAADRYGRLILDDLEYKMNKYKGQVRLVTVTGASNVTGFINPVHKIAAIAHRHGAAIMVDGAQLVPHVKFDMKPHDSIEHIDYVAFSGHKMYAPFGAGALIGRRETFESCYPEYSGGGTVKLVTHNHVTWDDPPEKEEAGTPNVMGVVALAEAIKTLESIGMDNIHRREKELTLYALDKLKKMDDIIIYGNDEEACERVGIIPFNIKGITHQLTAQILSFEGGISVRDGCFCAQPYVQKLLQIPEEQIKTYIADPSSPRPGMVRISFGLYNTFSEIDYFIKILKKIISNKDFYVRNY